MSLQLGGFQDVSYQKHFIPGRFLPDASTNIVNQDISPHKTEILRPIYNVCVVLPYTKSSTMTASKVSSCSACLSSNTRIFIYVYGGGGVGGINLSVRH